MKAYELIWDEKASKVVARVELDYTTLSKVKDVLTHQVYWMQYASDPARRRILLDCQIEVAKAADNLSEKELVKRTLLKAKVPFTTRTQEGYTYYLLTPTSQNERCLSLPVDAATIVYPFFEFNIKDELASM